MTLLDRARNALRGVRTYRFDTEQANHEEALRERQVSLSLMASATDDPGQIRMATEIEEDSENRLAVLLEKPRLSLAEKRERDDIQRALQKRRQGFDAPVLETRKQPWAPTRFLGPLAASPVMAILASPLTWIAMGLAVIGIQTARLSNAKGDLKDARADLAMAERNLTAARTERDLLAEAVVQADQLSQQTAANIEEERRLRSRTETELRRIRRAMAEAGSDGPIDYGFGSVRDAGEPAPGSNSGASTGSGNPR